MTKELLKAHVAELISESMAVRAMNMQQYGMAAGLGHSTVSNYASGKKLPMTDSWSKLMAIFPELPDLRGHIAVANLEERQERYARKASRRSGIECYDSSLYDIMPQERDRVVRRVFGCHARQVAGYDDISMFVLVRLKKTPLAELRQNRMQVLCKLFAEARHAVQQ